MKKILSAAFLLFFVSVMFVSAYSMVGDGRDGNLTVTAASTVINNYTTTTAALTAGQLNFTLSNCANITNGSDIIIMDMDGANRSRWESHLQVSINSSCFVSFISGDNITYSTSANVQVIKVPNYDNLTINSGASIVAPAVSQSTHMGGVIAFKVKRYLDTQGTISAAGLGYVGGAADIQAGCSGTHTATQGTDYQAAGGVSTAANVAGGGGAKTATATCRADGGGGAGQSGAGGAGAMTGSCVGAQVGDAGSSSINTTVHTYLQIGGGGGGGAACLGGSGTVATTGATGGGVIIIYANTSINLRADVSGATATSTTNGDGEGGNGASGSMYLDIHNVTFTSVLAPAISGGGGAGAAGIIGGHINVSSGTTSPSFVSYGNFISTVFNRAPNVTGISFSNTSAIAGANVTAWVAVNEPDGDAYIINWNITANGAAFLNGTYASSANGNFTVTSFLASTSTVYILNASASDGTLVSAVLSANISGFRNLGIAWATYIANTTQNWNVSFNLTANATNLSTSCILQNYTTNDSRFPINLTSGLMQIISNQSNVGYWSLMTSAADNCSDIITQNHFLNITYHSINLTAVTINPSPTGTTSDLVCNYTLNNTDNGEVSVFYKWFKNNTENTTYQNLTTILKGNLTLGDSWICAVRVNDTQVTIDFVNSTALVLGDSTPPLINSFSQSDSAPIVTTGSNTFTVNATDLQSIGSVKIQIQSNSFAAQNFTASFSSGNLYTYTFTPGLTETYTAIAYALDGSNNINSSSSLNFTPISAPVTPPSSGGGGGASSTPTASSLANFQVSPIAKTIMATIGTNNINEFEVINEGADTIYVNITIDEELSDKLAIPFVDFTGTKQLVTNQEVSTGKQLISNSVFIRYNVKPLIGTPVGTYHVTFNVVSGSVVKQHTVTIKASESVFTPLISFWEYELAGKEAGCTTIFEGQTTCTTNSFSFTVGNLIEILVGVVILIFVVRALSTRRKAE